MDQELAVEVQQCPLRPGAGEEQGSEEEKEKAAEEGLKSNNAHLAGGETR